MRHVENRVLERARARDLQDDSARMREMLRRAELLPEQDRLLVELALRQVSRRRIAKLLNLTAGSVCRRVQRLSRRLHDPVVIALLNERCPLPPEIRQMAVERLLLGMTVKSLAQKHGIKPAEVKKRLGFVSGWHQGLGAGRRLWELAL